MVAIPVLAGAYASPIADWTVSYPRNLEPVITATGFSKGYLHIAPGITFLDTGPGPDRGSINWAGPTNGAGVCYRVMGNRLVSVVGDTISDLGDVQTNLLPVSMTYSFDYLAIASNDKLWYWSPGGGVQRVTDPDLGVVIDVLWIAGYFMTTDGTSLVVTDLNDPFSINPLHYGSSEDDPDPILALRTVRGEVYALNRFTIQNFINVGGNGFPFQNNDGALIPKGCVGTHATCYFLETFAFVGSGHNEQLSVYLAGAGAALPISTSDVDRELAQLTPAQQALIQLEARVEQGEQRLLMHLPDKTLVYNHQATQTNGSPVWHILASGTGAQLPYTARHLCLAEGRWIVGDDTGRVGYLDETVTTHFGDVAEWLFDTVFLYKGGTGGIIKTLELVGLPGRAPFGAVPTCFMSVTRDGAVWSVDRAISQGKPGERSKRVQWRPKLRFRNYIGFRFRGSNTAFASWAHLEADIEPLAV